MKSGKVKILRSSGVLIKDNIYNFEDFHSRFINVFACNNKKEIKPWVVSKINEGIIFEYIKPKKNIG